MLGSINVTYIYNGKAERTFQLVAPLADKLHIALLGKLMAWHREEYISHILERIQLYTQNVRLQCFKLCYPATDRMHRLGDFGSYVDGIPLSPQESSARRSKATEPPEEPQARTTLRIKIRWRRDKRWYPVSVAFRWAEWTLYCDNSLGVLT